MAAVWRVIELPSLAARQQDGVLKIVGIDEMQVIGQLPSARSQACVEGQRVRARHPLKTVQRRVGFRRLLGGQVAQVEQQTLAGAVSSQRP